MANTMRWRYGDTAPSMYTPGSAVNIGDLLAFRPTVWGPDEVEPVSYFSYFGDQSQEMFAGRFAGVAMSRSDGVQPVRVATRGVFEFDCDGRAWRLSDRVACGGDQRVAPAANAFARLGVVTRHYDIPTTRVLVDIWTCHRGRV